MLTYNPTSFEDLIIIMLNMTPKQNNPLSPPHIPLHHLPFLVNGKAHPADSPHTRLNATFRNTTLSCSNRNPDLPELRDP